MEDRKIVLVDLDGTLSFIGDRVKYLLQKPVNWAAVHAADYDDKPHLDMIRLVKEMAFLNYTIIFCTGRDEVVREQTQTWLDKYGLGDYKLLMRPSGDESADGDMKVNLLIDNEIEMDNIYFVLEDRNSVVKSWRNLGIRVLQVQEGDF